MNRTNDMGTIISELRKAKGVTQDELARYVGVSAQAVSKWENGGVPDTELLPKIANYFDVSIDKLFGREHLKGDISTAIFEQIRKHEAHSPERFREAFDLCWDIERSLFDVNFIKPNTAEDLKQNRIADCENELRENDQSYSVITTDYGFTRVGVANRLQYFLLVPEIRNKDTALLNGIDYPTFFKVLSDQDLFRAMIMLYKRDERKAFTESLLMKELSLDMERAKDIITSLKALKHIRVTKLELDDEIKDVYTFNPTTSFVAMLIFAREMIDWPRIHSYQTEYRSKPYLENL